MKLTLPAPIQNIVGILNWQLGPEVLPKSQVLLAVTLVAFGVAVFLRQAMDYSVARAVASGIGGAAVLAVAAFICAIVSGHRERLPQTLTALALCGAIVLSVATALRYLLIVALVFSDPSDQALPYVNVVQLANFVLFPLLVWNVFVFAALFRRSFRPSVPIAFAIAILVVMVIDFLVPVAFRSL